MELLKCLFLAWIQVSIITFVLVNLLGLINVKPILEFAGKLYYGIMEENRLDCCIIFWELMPCISLLSLENKLFFGYEFEIVPKNEDEESDDEEETVITIDLEEDDSEDTKNSKE